LGGPHIKTRRHSKITDELPPEVQSMIDRFLIQGSTYPEIADFLKAKGYDISKSSVGRYGKDYLAAYQRLRIIEDQSRTLVSEAGDGLVLEEAGGKLMAQKIIEILLTPDMKGVKIPELAIGLASIIKANVSREKFKTDLKKKVEKVFEKTEKKMQSMSKEEMLRTIKEEVYGLT
jgi:hypothetical protein